MTTPDLDHLSHLETLAKAATPGPWVRYAFGHTVPGYDIIPGVVSDKWSDRCAHDTPSSEDADYIAAANPATVLALIRELRAAREVVEVTRMFMNAELATAVDVVETIAAYDAAISSTDAAEKGAKP